MSKLWGGRFSDEPSPELMAFTESLSFDHILAADDCVVLAAHARALARAGVLGDDDAARAANVLEQIAAAARAGNLRFDPADEDVHTMVERALFERLPTLAPKLRAGLSRNDRVATALRLWLLREGAQVVVALTGLIETLLARAREHRDVLVPGYTHLQRAQPVTLAHHLLAHASAFERDVRRLFAALAGADASPLGAGALAGTTLSLDATETADDLGFADVIPNSLDAVSARDFVAEFLAAAAILAVHCSRLGEEIVLWTSSEFGFAELSDAFATGSSLMPQKKNPDVAELARGKAGRVIGDLTSVLITLKGLPLAYDRDLQEDKEPLFDAVRTLRAMLPALSGAVATMRFDAARMAAAAADPSLLATDIAEHLVRQGMPFAEAHESVGKMVRRSVEERRPLDEVAAETLGNVVFDARTSVRSRPMPGPGDASVDEQFARLESALEGIHKAFE